MKIKMKVGRPRPCRGRLIVEFGFIILNEAGSENPPYLDLEFSVLNMNTARRDIGPYQDSDLN